MFLTIINIATKEVTIMAKKTDNVNETTNVAEFDQATPLAYIVKEGDTFYVVNYSNEAERKECKISKDGLCLIVPENDSNRKFYMLAKANKELETVDKIELTYKASKKFAPAYTKIPNEKLLVYLSEEDKATYMAIIKRAQEAMEADVAKPRVADEKSKLEAKLAKAKAQYEKLLAELNAEQTEA